MLPAQDLQTLMQPIHLMQGHSQSSGKCMMIKSDEIQGGQQLLKSSHQLWHCRCFKQQAHRLNQQQQYQDAMQRFHQAFARQAGQLLE